MRTATPCLMLSLPMYSESKRKHDTPISKQAGGAVADAVEELLALTMKTFVLIVTFAAAGVTDDVRTERIASFDDYQSCVSAGRAMYPHQHWECVPQNQLPQGSTGR